MLSFFILDFMVVCLGMSLFRSIFLMEHPLYVHDAAPPPFYCQARTRSQ